MVVMNMSGDKCDLEQEMTTRTTPKKKTMPKKKTTTKTMPKRKTEEDDHR